MPKNVNAALVRRYFEECVNAVNGTRRDRALAIVDELIASDFTMFYNNDTDAQATQGRERHKEFLVNHARAFPEDRWSIEALVADDAIVACQWRIQARHVQTRNPIDVRAADFFVVRGGHLAELRRFLDFADLDRQIEGASETA